MSAQIRLNPQRRALRLAAALSLIGVSLVTTLAASPAGAATDNQVNVGPNVNCALNGLHQGAGPVSTCRELTITTQVLVNGADVPTGTVLDVGDVITVRLTVPARGGHDAFYQETVDGIRNNNNDLRFGLDIELPGQTGTNLSAPANVRMSRTDNGDRGNGPLINCLAHGGQNGAVSDGATAVTLGGGNVGGTQMNAALAGTTLTARWDQMSFDRCVRLLSNNGYYGGHTVEFEQTVTELGVVPLSPTWNLGQVALQRKDGSREILWGEDKDLDMVIPAKPAGPVGVVDLAAVDAQYAGQSPTSVSIDLLDNDTGTGTLQVSAVSATTSGGTVDCGALPSAGPCTYTPAEGFSGTDTFTYDVTDDNGTSTVQATVEVLPNAAPDADDDVATTMIDTVVSGDVVTNDTDSDDDPMVVDTTPVSGPANGTVVLAADGSYTYTPDAGFFGTDSFEYQVCDEHPMIDRSTTSRCSTATATITVDPGAGPEAIGDAAVTDVDTAVAIDVLGNDDAGDAGPVTIATAGTNGIAGQTAVGGTVTCTTTCTYTPPAGYSGSDAFTYTITDTSGQTSSATVVLEVVGNHAPLAVDDAIVAEQDGPAVSGDLAGNDLELDGESLIYTTTPVAAPTQGTVVVNADGTFTYTPEAGTSGTDTFTYEVCDDHTDVAGAPAPACSEAIVTVTVTPTPLLPPLAVEDGGLTDTDVVLDIDVLSNDSDPDGLPADLSIVAAGYGGTAGMTQAGGTVACASTCTYTPPLGFDGTDAFTYTITDSDGLTATAFVLIDVAGNLAPVAGDDFSLTPAGTTVEGDLSANDVELDEENLIFSTTPIVDPSHGTVSIASDGTFSYTPEAGYAGADEFVYEVCDDHALRDGTPEVACTQAKATILVGHATVNDVADASAALAARLETSASGSGGSRSAGSVLARTGSELAPLVGLGLLALGAGIGLLTVRRRRLGTPA